MDRKDDQQSTERSYEVRPSVIGSEKGYRRVLGKVNNTHFSIGPIGEIADGLEVAFIDDNENIYEGPDIITAKQQDLEEVADKIVQGLQQGLTPREILEYLTEIG